MSNTIITIIIIIVIFIALCAIAFPYAKYYYLKLYKKEEFKSYCINNWIRWKLQEFDRDFKEMVRNMKNSTTTEGDVVSGMSMFAQGISSLKNGTGVSSISDPITDSIKEHADRCRLETIYINDCFNDLKSIRCECSNVVDELRKLQSIINKIRSRSNTQGTMGAFTDMYNSTFGNKPFDEQTKILMDDVEKSYNLFCSLLN